MTRQGDWRCECYCLNGGHEAFCYRCGAGAPEPGAIDFVAYCLIRPGPRHEFEYQAWACVKRDGVWVMERWL